MTVVLVHGNPETDEVWGPLKDALGRRGVTDIECLSPPGFGAPVPDGFGATVDEYRDWLIGELERFPEPVDLVGHDWGGGHVLNAVMSRPELVRSWTSDVVALFDPDYVWHDLAQVWQRPGDGEELVAQMLGGTAAERAARLVPLGMTQEVAERVAAGQGEEMGRCILALYRDAAQPAMAERGRDLPKAAARPGLAINATEDHFVGTAEMVKRSADRAGASVAVLDGLGHWWMVQDPEAGAEALVRFWAER
ncbi:alpha/beta fold hydrolase [Pseudonocardia acaciae]|uniref:alpha/beta fold hydrolase n=1 Tax=Pseudonocardia acaciae TaxID=551276 RepID=UPI00049182EC|nr:alpha/beta hydrolase [Pseudonocardia acaciae]